MENKCLLLSVIFLTITTLNSGWKYSASFNNKVFGFTKFLDPCSGRDNSKHSMHYRNFKQISEHSFDYDLVVDKPIPTLSISIHFWRCSSAEALDSCIPISVFKVGPACKYMNSTTDAWSPMMECMRPKMGCPFKRTTYRGRNCTIDFNAFKFFPLGHSYWKGHIVGWNGRTELYCTSAEGSLIR